MDKEKLDKIRQALKAEAAEHTKGVFFRRENCRNWEWRGCEH